MNKLEALLAAEDTILLDGAMGTMLMASGLTQGDPPEEWNVTRPEVIRAIHRDYIRSGSRIILTNTFGGNRHRLKLHKFEDRVYEFNRAAAELARSEADQAPHLVVVAGSMGPTGELIEPLGLLTSDGAREAFAEQAEALEDGGVDVLWIETKSDLAEVKAAVQGAKEATDLPVVVTMTFDTRGHTMMGVSPVQALESLRELGLAALGANCGNGVSEIEGVIQAMRGVDKQVLLIAKSNAGIPQWVNNELVYDGTPEVMAGYARTVQGLGARLIGACCGSTPEHIRAMADALGIRVPVTE